MPSVLFSLNGWKKNLVAVVVIVIAVVDMDDHYYRRLPQSMAMCASQGASLFANSIEIGRSLRDTTKSSIVYYL